MSTARTLGLALLGTFAILAGARLLGLVGGPRGDEGRAIAAAPAFQLPRLGGGQVSFDAGAGRVTLLDFFATWCGPCRQALPRVDALHRKLKDRGLDVIAVDAEPPEAREFAEKLARDLGLQLPIALAGDGIAERYHVDNLPTTVVIDKRGRVARVLLGVHTEEELGAIVEPLLN